jgi:hypothetical protein
VRGDATTSRRGALRTGALATIAISLAPAAASCTDPPPPPPPDPLAELAARARTDAAAARSIASAVPDLAPRATQVATARGEHALALQREVDRERPPRTSTSSAPSTSAAPGPADPADPGTARTTLLDALVAAERQAAELVTVVPRYRAGLLGSVAASCASLREVIG